MAFIDIHLSVAVPMWIHELKSIPCSELQGMASECADVIASKGDVLQFGGGKNGDAARAFNALAKGLAIGAFSPGGIQFMGMRFVARHPDDDTDVVQWDARGCAP